MRKGRSFEDSIDIEEKGKEKKHTGDEWDMEGDGMIVPFI